MDDTCSLIFHFLFSHFFINYSFTQRTGAPYALETSERVLFEEASHQKIPVVTELYDASQLYVILPKLG